MQDTEREGRERERGGGEGERERWGKEIIQRQSKHDQLNKEHGKNIATNGNKLQTLPRYSTKHRERNRSTFAHTCTHTHLSLTDTHGHFDVVVSVTLEPSCTDILASCYLLESEHLVLFASAFYVIPKALLIKNLIS